MRPCGSWRHVFMYRGINTVQQELLFEAKLPRGVEPESLVSGPQASGDGSFAMRWWTTDELDSSTETVWPNQLSSRLTSYVPRHGRA